MISSEVDYIVTDVTRTTTLSFDEAKKSLFSNHFRRILLSSIPEKVLENRLHRVATVILTDIAL